MLKSAYLNMGDYGKMVMGGKSVLVLVLLLFSVSFTVFADTTIGNPSVTKFKEVKGSGDPSYTGSMQLSIPLYTLPGRNGLDFPIVLNYQAGIKTAQEAGSVGLGFSISPGSVQRGVDGFIDEKTVQSSSSHLNIGGFGACVNKLYNHEDSKSITIKFGEIQRCTDDNAQPRDCTVADCSIGTECDPESNNPSDGTNAACLGHGSPPGSEPYCWKNHWCGGREGKYCSNVADCQTGGMDDGLWSCLASNICHTSPSPPLSDYSLLRKCHDDDDCSDEEICRNDGKCHIYSASSDNDLFVFEEHALVQGASSKVEAQESDSTTINSNSVKRYAGRLGCAMQYNFAGYTLYGLECYDDLSSETTVERIKELQDQCAAKYSATVRIVHVFGKCVDKCRYWTGLDPGCVDDRVLDDPQVRDLRESVPFNQWCTDLGTPIPLDPLNHGMPEPTYTLMEGVNCIEEYEYGRDIKRAGSLVQDTFFALKNEGHMMDNYFLSFPGGASRLMINSISDLSFAPVQWKPWKVNADAGLADFSVVDASGNRYVFGSASNAREIATYRGESYPNVEFTSNDASEDNAYSTDEMAGGAGYPVTPPSLEFQQPSLTNLGYSYEYLCSNGADFSGGGTYHFDAFDCSSEEGHNRACSLACVCPYPYTFTLYAGGGNWVEKDWRSAGDAYAIPLDKTKVRESEYDPNNPYDSINKYVDSFNYQIKFWEPKKRNALERQEIPCPLPETHQYLAFESGGAGGGSKSRSDINLVDKMGGRAMAAGSISTRPAHTVSWLLEDIQSPDYADSNTAVAGSDPLDKGSYVKFTYEDWGTKVETKEGKVSEDLFGSDDDFDYQFAYDPDDPAQTDLVQVKINRKVKSTTTIALKEIKTIETPLSSAEFIYNDPIVGDDPSTCGVTNHHGIVMNQVPQLDCIIIKDMSGNRVSKLVFNYATGNDRKLKAWNGESYGQRTLLGVKQYGEDDSISAPPFLFDYGNRFSFLVNPAFDATTFLNTVGVANTDAWGYYTATGTGVADENSDVWSLKKVTYPTGGSVEYVYESNRYRFEPCDIVGQNGCLNGHWEDAGECKNGDVNTGGCNPGYGPRLASVTSYYGRTDNSNPPSSTTTFEYVDGVASQKPYYNGQTYDWNSGASQRYAAWNTVGMVDNSIGYSKVITHLPESGTVETSYTTARDVGDEDYYRYKSSAINPFTNSFYPVGGFLTSNEWKRGLVKQVLSKDTTEAIVKQDDYFYESDLGSISPKTAWTVNSGGNDVFTDESGASNTRIPAYSIRSGMNLLTRAESRVDGVTSKVLYWHNANGQVRKKSEYQGDVGPAPPQKITEFWYAYEIDNDQGVLMLERNMLTPVRSTVVGHKDYPLADMTGYLPDTIFDQSPLYQRNIDSYVGTSYAVFDDRVSDSVYPSSTENWMDLDENGYYSATAELIGTTFDTYDSYGHVTQTTDPAGHKTQFFYGGSGQCDAEASLHNGYLTCLRQCKDASCSTYLEKKAYYNSDGMVDKIKDENNVETSFKYDALNRLIKKIVPPDTETVPTEEYGYHFATSIDSDMNWVSTKLRMDVTDASKTSESYSFADGLGRDLQSATKKADSGMRSVRSLKQFTAQGLVKSESNAFENAADAGTYVPSAAESKMSSYEYYQNPLNRVWKVYPLGETADFVETEYGNDAGKRTVTVKTFKEGGELSSRVLTRTKMDFLGRMVEQIADVGGANQVTTITAYNDILGRSVDVTNPSGQVSKSRSDTLGRVRVSMSPDFGGTAGSRRNLKYDANGNILLSADGCDFSDDFTDETRPAYNCDRYTSYTYDALNRLKTVDYGGNGVDVTYYYDTYAGAPAACTAPATEVCDADINCPKGRLVAVTNTYSGSSTYCYYYDARGQLRKELRSIGGSPAYQLLYSYDNAGNMKTLTYPNSKVVSYDYNVLNQVETVSVGPDVLHLDVLQSLSYQPDGLVQSKTYDRVCS